MAAAIRPVFRFEKESHKYFFGDQELPSVTRVLIGAGLIDTQWYTEVGRARGSAIHIACQFDDEGDLDEETLDPAVAPYLEAWRAFRKDTGFEPTETEQPSFDAIRGYAGTPDRIGRRGNKKSVVDIKSGGKHPAYQIQLAAYANLQLEPMSYERLQVRLQGDGKYFCDMFPKSEFMADLNIFLSGLNVLNFKRKYNL